MSFLSWGVDSVKIGCQLISGDTEGAGETARNLAMSTPGLGHTAAVMAKVCGNDEAARELLEEANRQMDAMTNSIPGVGHAKGVALYVSGDVEGGNEAMLAATRATAVMAAKSGGFLVGGPLGAAAAEAGTDIIWNTATSNTTDDKNTQSVLQILKDPTNVRNYVDAGLGLVDGMAGFSVSDQINQIVKDPSDPSNYVNAGLGLVDEMAGCSVSDHINQIQNDLSNSSNYFDAAINVYRDSNQ